MTADEFVMALRNVTPSADELMRQGETLEFTEQYLSRKIILTRPKPYVMGHKVSPLFTELFSKYDLSKLVISYFTFFDQPVLHDQRWFFGADEGERLCIDPITQEICAEEGPKLYIEGGYAKDFDHFMAAMLVVAEYCGRYTIDAPPDIRLQYAIRTAKAAGGKRYKGFLAYDIDSEAYELALDAM
jgi:hypothetical protein